MLIERYVKIKVKNPKMKDWEIAQKLELTTDALEKLKNHFGMKIRNSNDFFRTLFFY